MSTMRYRTIGCVLLLMLGMQLFVAYQLRGPQPLPATAPPDQFSAERARAVLERLLGDESPHATGTEENARVREQLVAELDSLGVDAEIHESPNDREPRKTLSNVLARLPGSPDTGRPLVLATHYDSVSAGPGAADAGSCVVALLETTRALLHTGTLRRPVYLLITDGEEAGMLGASDFVDSHVLAQEKPFVMNFEARGTSGPSLMFETHRNNLSAVRLFARHSPYPTITGSSFVTVYRVLPNNTDFTIFYQDGWTGFNFAFIGDAHNYHTAEDNLANLSERSLQHHGQNALALARAISENEQLDLEASAEDAVFFDVLGLRVFWFPASWAWPLALVPLMLLVVRIGLQLRSPTTDLRSLGYGAAKLSVAVVLMFSIAAAVGYIGTRLFVSTGILSRAHVPYSGWLAACYIPVSFAIVACLARLFLRGVPGRTVWLVFWTSWSAVGLVIAALLPGFSYYLLLPAVVASCLAWLPAPTGGRVVVVAILSAVVLLPLANLLPVALGARAAVIFHPAFVLLWLPLLPLFAAADDMGEKTQVNAAETG